MMVKSQWHVEFYPDNRNRYPVLEYIEQLPVEEQAKVRHHLRLLKERGTELREPHAKAIKGHKPLWELRPKPHRIFYFLYNECRFILLHAFQKKRLRTDEREIERAERRMDNFLERVR